MARLKSRHDPVATACGSDTAAPTARNVTAQQNALGSLPSGGALTREINPLQETISLFSEQGS